MTFDLPLNKYSQFSEIMSITKFASSLCLQYAIARWCQERMVTFDLSMLIFEPWPHMTCARLRDQAREHLTLGYLQPSLVPRPFPSSHVAWVWGYLQPRKRRQQVTEGKNVTRLRLEEVWSILITSVTVHTQLGRSELFKYGTLWARTPPASHSYAR